MVLNFSNLTTTIWLRLTCLTCPQVRLELQSCVSRQQEALRCREVCLLSQIELLEQVKTETLQQQLQQLHWVSLSSDQSKHSTATWATAHLNPPPHRVCSSSEDSLM